MGEVYEAFDHARQTRVAVKTLSDLDPEKLLALKHEFRSLANVNHPNLVSFYELVLENGRWLLSMEYVVGMDLLSYVRPNGACDIAKLKLALPQIIQGISAIHRAGLLHRDLKPSNVLVTPDDRVVVLDFGLATQIHPAAFESPGDDLAGTVAYMSPEHATSQALTEASDWYALGVMLFESLSGRLPFSGSALSILADKNRLDPPPLESVVPEAPAYLAKLTNGLLRRDVTTRLTGMDALRVLDDPAVQRGTAPTAPAKRLFVGREGELAVLHNAFRSMTDAPRMVSVHGPSGIGKSALISHFLGDIAGDAMILAGRCYERESVPYKAFDSAFDRLARQLDQLDEAELRAVIPRDAGALIQVFPVFSRIQLMAAARAAVNTAIEPTELRRRAFAGIRQLFRALAERQRLVLYIDDLQWADLDSAALLREMLRPPAAPRVLLIGSWRRGLESKSAFLEAMQGESFRSLALDVQDLPVGPLSAAETQALATAIASDGGTSFGGRIEAALRESGGNPYFLRELIAGGSEQVSPERQLTLDDVLRIRVAGLPDDARRVLEIVCLAGGALHEDDLRRAAGLDRADQKTLPLLRAQNMVQAVADEIEPYHDRVRETVVASLDREVRRSHHAALADALRSSSASRDAEGLAVHLEALGERDEAGRLYAMAAERARTALAFVRAAELFAKALALSSVSADQRRRLQAKVAEALGNAGRVKQAAQMYREAARGSVGAEAIELARHESTWFITAGYIAEGRSALQRFLPAAGLHLPPPRLLTLNLLAIELRLALRGVSFTERRESRIPREVLNRVDYAFDATRAFLQTDTPTGVYFTNRNLLMALGAGEPARIARVLALKLITAQGFRSPFGARQVRRMYPLFDTLCADADNPYTRGVHAWVRAYEGFFSSDYQAMHRHMLAAETTFREECTGVVWERTTSANYALVALAHLGRVSEIMDRAEDLVREGAEREEANMIHSLGVHARPFAFMGRDDPSRAHEILDAARDAWSYSYTLQMAATAFVKTWVYLYEGRASEAWTFVSGEWPQLRRHNFLRLHQLWNWVTHARAQAALAMQGDAGQNRRWLAVAEKAASSLERDDVSAASPGIGRLIRAGIEARRGNPAASIALLRQALAVFDDLQMVAFAGVTRRRLAQMLGGDSGATLLAEADASMREVGILNPERMTCALANGFEQLS